MTMITEILRGRLKMPIVGLLGRIAFACLT